MGLAEFYYLAATLVAGIAATAGYGVLSLTPAHFQVARRAFWTSALLFASIGIVWGITTPESAQIRIAAVAIVGALSLVGLTEALRWVKGRESLESGPRTAGAPLLAPEPSTIKLPRYLPSYADYMSVQLRQMRNVINESCRDSTSVPGFFKNWSGSRAMRIMALSRHTKNPQLPSITQEIGELQDKVSELKKFYADCEGAVNPILAKDPSYTRDLRPFAESAFISPDYANLLAEFYTVLSAFKNNERLDGNALQVIEGYGAKIATKHEEQWKRSVAAMENIDAKLVDLSNNR